MIIDNIKLLDSLNGLGILDDEIFDADYLDLNDPKVRENLSRLNTLAVRLGYTDDVESEFEQLCLLVDNCPNITRFTATFINRERLNSINGNKLLDKLISNGNVKDIYLPPYYYNYEYIFKKVNELNGRVAILLPQISDKNWEMKYINSNSNFKRKLMCSNFSSPEISELNSVTLYKRLSLELYRKYKDQLSNVGKFKISIANVSQLSCSEVTELKKDGNISGIVLRSGYQRHDLTNFYTLDEYYEIRKTIDVIVSRITVPPINTPNREKLIFAQIYKLLGQNISYDHYAITDEGEKDTQLASDCRNLKNGLLGVTRNGKKEYMCVCAGYATILQNVCSMFNIKCDYIDSFSREIRDNKTDNIGEHKRVYENGTDDPEGHAYNSVQLDGQSYFCDLTWDRHALRRNSIATNFLCSYEDFYKSHWKTGFSDSEIAETELITQTGEKVVLHKIRKEDYQSSLPYEYQVGLFSIIAKEKIDEMVRKNYLSGFVSEYLEYVKQCKNGKEISNYVEIISNIQTVEQAVLDEHTLIRSFEQPIYDKNRKHIGSYKAIYDKRKTDNNATKKDVEKMGGGTWKLR